MRGDKRLVRAGRDELVTGVHEVVHHRDAWYGANGVLSAGSQVAPVLVQLPLDRCRVAVVGLPGHRGDRAEAVVHVPTSRR